MKEKIKRFSYRDYESKLINHEDVEEHLRGFVRYFKGCRKVVDVGSGPGIFLKHLKKEGIPGVGIENDPDLAEKVRAENLEVIQGDAGSLWEKIPEFDGLFCSHVLEHLPFEKVLDLVEGIAARILPGGTAVFAFPNPESVEMQLFHFWRDPQHVRFYHPDLIACVLAHYGFEIQENYSQGFWTDEPEQFMAALPAPGAPAGAARAVSAFRRLVIFLKKSLGLERLEVEADYFLRLRRKGRESVIVARKIRGEGK